MIYAWFYIRWQIARGLICVAMFVAPKGPARDLLWSHLRRFSIEVLSAITVMKPDPLSPANIEAVARAYCRRMGMDPDAESLRQTGCITMIWGRARLEEIRQVNWRHFEAKAREAIAMRLAIEETIG